MTACINRMPLPALAIALLLACGCGRRQEGAGRASEAAPPERGAVAALAPAAERADVQQPAGDVSAAAPRPAATPEPAAAPLPRQLPKEDVREAGAPLPASHASKESGQWMTGTAEARAAAIRVANLGTRTLPAELNRMAKQGSEESIEALLALSREPGRIGLEAIQALSGVGAEAQRVRLAEELKKRLDEADAGVASACIRSYVILRGDESLEEVRRFLPRSYNRQDGLGESVCAAAVKAVGELDTDAADRVLGEELKRVVQPDWLPDYGSAVVKALAKTELKEVRTNLRGYTHVRPPRPLSAEARAALEAYAEGLRRKMPGADNPPGRQYIEEKIAEVSAALAQAGRTARRPGA